MTDKTGTINDLDELVLTTARLSTELTMERPANMVNKLLLLCLAEVALSFLGYSWMVSGSEFENHSDVVYCPLLQTDPRPQTVRNIFPSHTKAG